VRSAREAISSLPCAAQVVLDRLGCDEQRLGDLPVAPALGRQTGDAQLTRCQGVEPAQPGTAQARPASSASARTLGDGDGAAARGDLERPAERPPCLHPMAQAPEGGAEV
jgi:hypothetical protein